jgi:hypothetical protein
MKILSWIGIGMAAFVLLVGYMVLTNGHPLGKY